MAKKAGSKRTVKNHKPTEHARNYSQIAWEFALVAEKDKKKYCKWVRLAAKRHLDDIENEPELFRFDEWNANDVCDFIEQLPHIEGEWETKTITLEPPQIFILVCVFGWRKKKNDKRRFTKVYIEMARKGAKSTLTAGVALYCVACEEEVGPQVIIGATTGDQTNKVFKPAQEMVRKTPELREEFGLTVWAHSISCDDSGGYIQPINSKSSTQDGWNPHAAILDELHAHKDRGLYDVIQSAFGARKNPLLWIITTAGYNVDGVCYEQRTLVTKILEGVVEADHYFGIIFTLDEGDDELDPNVWIKANPMLGIIPSLDEMVSYAKEAKASPDSMGEFKTKRLNIWTLARNAWLNIEQWKKCDGPVDLNVLKDVPCWGGVDLAATSDITSFALVWLFEGRLKIWAAHYLPEETIREHAKKKDFLYKQWEEKGLLISTPGNVTDYDYIEKDIKKALDIFNIKNIGYDRWNATQVVNNLMAEGAPMVEMRQGAKTFHPPMNEMERLLKGRLIDHGGNPVLQWMASNIIARKDVNNNMAPDKKNSQGKIDGIVAALEAIGLMLNEEDTTSVYEKRGIRTL